MWKKIFIIEIYGKPMATQRARFNGRYAYTPTKTRQAMNRRIALIKNAMNQQGITTLDCPLRVELDFIHPRPKRLMAKKYSDEKILKTTKPDVDNLAKLLLDSGSQAQLWKDDNQICQLEIKDWYTDRTNEPKSVMIVKRMTKDNGEKI